MIAIRYNVSRFASLLMGSGPKVALLRAWSKLRFVLLRDLLDQVLLAQQQALLPLRVAQAEQAAVQVRLADAQAQLTQLQQTQWRESLRMAQRQREFDQSLRALAQWMSTPAFAPGVGPVGLLISIVMPTRNRLHSLLAAVKSVQAQTHIHWELLVVDDGGQDGTREAMGCLCRQDERIRYLRCETSGGAAMARNLALSQARGQVVCYLDDDNTYFPNHLAAVAHAYAGPSAPPCAYVAQFWDAAEQGTRISFEAFDWSELLAQRMSIDMNAFSHRRSLVAELGGFDETLLRHNDWDLALRYTRVHPPQRIAVMGVHYRWKGSDSISERYASQPFSMRIAEKFVHAEPTGVRVLYLVHNHPQLSESYVETEIDWLLSRGIAIEVFQQTPPTAPGQSTVPVSEGDLSACVGRFRPHLIMVHWESMVDAWASELARFELPVFVRHHGFDHDEDRVHAQLALPWLKRSFSFPHFISPRMADSGKVVPLPAAFDSRRYYPVEHKNRRQVLRCGACLPTKDLHSFVDIALLCPDHQFVLVLASNASGRDTATSIEAHNAAHGHVVRIVWDLQYNDMSRVMRESGIYLHTFGFEQAFGQPISIAEAMACGTVPLVRRSAAAQAYCEDQAIYYDTPEEAAAALHALLEWDDAQWQLRAKTASAFAYARHADHGVFPVLLAEILAHAGRDACEPLRPLSESKADVLPARRLAPVAAAPRRGD